MRYILHTLFCLAIAIFSNISHAQYCEGVPHDRNRNPYWWIGNVNNPEEGNKFCDTIWQNGVTITGIEAWYRHDRVAALRAFYSNGVAGSIYGKLDGYTQHARLDWDYSSATVKQATLWGNGGGGALGRVQLILSDGQEFNIGNSKSEDPGYPFDVESGILLALEGRHADFMHSLGLLFLRSKIKSATLTDLKFKDTIEDLNSKMQGLVAKSLDSATHTNNASTTAIWKFGKRIRVKQSKSFTNTVEKKFGFKQTFTVSGTFLGIGASSSTTLEYEERNQQIDSASFEEEHELNFETTYRVKPKQTLYCRAFGMVGKYTGEYTATVNLELEDGSPYSFTETGTMKDVTWSDSKSECRNVPFEDPEDEPLQPGEFQEVGQKRALKFLA